MRKYSILLLIMLILIAVSGTAVAEATDKTDVKSTAEGTQGLDIDQTGLNGYDLMSTDDGMVVQYTVRHPSSTGKSYFFTTVVGDVPLAGFYEGWCVQTGVLIDGSSTGPVYNAMVFSTYDEDIPYDDIPSGIDRPENFSIVNWIINQDYVGKNVQSVFNTTLTGTITFGDVQRAIWYAISDTGPSSPGSLQPYSEARAQLIIDAAMDNGVGFMPVYGDKIAYILIPVEQNSDEWTFTDIQSSIIETDFEASPSIDIEKYTNGHDADLPTGPTLSPGQAVTWTYIITNTGDVPLSNVNVTDDQGLIPVYQSGDNNNNNILDVGEVWIYEATGVTQCGQYANIGEVSAEWMEITVSDSDPSHYIVICEPDIEIKKYTNGIDASYPHGPQLGVGDTVTWDYVVKNTGNVALKNIVVVDDKIGTISDDNIISNGNGDDILDVGEVWTYRVSSTVEECIPLYRNVATVTGEDDQENIVTDEDASHYHCQPVVPLLTPLGILLMTVSLGLVGIFTMRRRK